MAYEIFYLLTLWGISDIENQGRNEGLNMNLYDQLLQLQVIPNAYSAWRSYRENLTAYIISQLEANQHVAIIGVGRSNDMDLAQLLPHVKKLTLIDKDEQALLTASKQYHLIGKSKVECLYRDLLGLDVEDYRQYANRLVSEVRRKGMATDLEVLLKVALDEFEKLALKIEPISLGHKCYDTTIVIGLHSQLLSMLEWIWQVILQTIGKEDQHLREAIMALTPKVISIFHEHLIEATVSKLITGCELSRKGREGTIQGAIQGLDDLNIKRQEHKLYKTDACVIEWPFNTTQQVIYNMLIQIDEIL